jgi:hypothetical protein
MLTEIVIGAGILEDPDRTTMFADVVGVPLFVFEPSLRYTVMQVEFDLRNAAAGPQPEPFCGGADIPLCLHIVRAGYAYKGGHDELPWVLENDYVTWQDPANTLGCPGATQRASSTWGRLKGLYR